MLRPILNKESDPAGYDHRFTLNLLHPRYWGTWLLLALMAVMAWVPVRWRDAMAARLAPLAVRLARKQSNVVRVNLQICFPDKTDAEREALLLANMRVGLQCMLGFGVPSFRSPEVLRRQYQVTGWEHVEAVRAQGKPIVFVMPHAWAIDIAGLYISLNGLSMCTMMHSVPNRLYDWFINRQRILFGGIVFERDAGLKPIIKLMRQGRSFFYLPDQDHGPQASVFVPFFGRMKATLPALPKLCKLTGAAAITMFVAYDAEQGRYQLTFEPALSDYPSGDVTADTARMNQEIEKLVARWPDQYMWFLKYFRSRPESDPGRTYPK